MKTVYALALLLVPVLAGCTQRSAAGAAMVTGEVVAFAADVALTQRAAEQEAAEQEREDAAREQQRLWARPDTYVVPKASSRDAVVVRERHPFDALEAKKSLRDANLAGCPRNAGPAIEGHAKVTYEPNGAPSRVVIDQPRDLPTATVTCVGAALGKTRVSPFEGGAITVGTGFRVP